MDDRQIKVLMIVPNLRVSSGVANFAMNYYRTVDHDKVKIDFATLNFRESPCIEEVKANGSEFFVLGKLFRHPVKFIKTAKKIIKEHDYDVIHDNVILMSLPIMKPAKKKVPVRILHSHAIMSGESKFSGFVNKLLLPLLTSKMTHFTACSSNAGKAMFGDKKFTVIPNIIDSDQFLFDDAERDAVRAKENAGNKLVVGSVGRLAELKNPFFAIDVMEEVLKRRSDIEYWWVGSGPLDEKIKQYVDAKGLSDRIKLLGSRDDMSGLYMGMDAFFLPSKGEGFGMACVEAEATGLPCVVSSNFPAEVNITGNVEFVPLDKDINTWSSTVINSLEKQTDRIAANKILRDSRYSKAGSGNVLTDFYLKALSEEEKK